MSAIGQAIDAVAARAAQEPEPEPRQMAGIPVLSAAQQWPENAEVLLDSQPTGPSMLLFDAEQRAWRVIVLPPDTRWRIAPDGPVRAQLWHPGMPT